MIVVAVLIAIAFIISIIVRAQRLKNGPSFDDKSSKRTEEIKDIIRKYNCKHEGFRFGSSEYCMGISIGIN